jgi:hypothetical protein
MSEEEEKSTALHAKEQEFKIDAALNALAMETLSNMSETVKRNPDIPEKEQLYVMLHAAEAITFNIIMHIAEQVDVSAETIAEKTKANLMDAIKAASEDADAETNHVH